MTDETFATEVGPDAVVVLDFWSETCVPCRKVSRILEELKDGVPAAKFFGVAVEENPTLVDRFEVQSVPTVVVLRGDDVVERFVGVERPQVLRKAIERHLGPDGGDER